MKNVIIAEQWKEFFAKHDLQTYEDFFDYTDANDAGKKRIVSKITLRDEDRECSFFLKRFYHAHLDDIILSLMNYQRVCSQGESEWLAAKRLLENGLGSYECVCFGEDKIFGFEKSSFILTVQLEEECLADFTKREWNELSDEVKCKIMQELGAYIRKVHEANISLPDLYVWHLYLADPKSKPRFSVIDLHRMKVGQVSETERIRNFGRLFYSMRDEYFNEKLQKICIESYMQGRSQQNVDAFFAKVKRVAAKIRKRRNIKPYETMK